MYPQQPPVYQPPIQYPPQQPQPQYPLYPQEPAYAPGPLPGQVQYAPQQPTTAPQQPTASGSLDQFYNQPGGATGKAWSFHHKPIGTTYTGIVSRAIANSDIQQQTDLNTGAPRFFRDGRPMFVMVVPLIVAPSPEFPEGQASWWVRGQARDDLVRAMAEAGAPEGPPESGAAIAVTLFGQRPSGPGRNPAYVYRVVYRRPDGEQQVAGVVQPVSQQPPAPVAVTQPVPVAPTGLSAEQQALLAKLTGG